MSGKDTMKHAAIYSGAAVMGRMVSFVMLPFYAHILSDRGYAVIGMLEVGLAFLSSLGSYAVHMAVIRFYHDEKDPVQKPRAVSTGIFLVVGGTLVIVMPIILLSRPLSGLLLDDANLSRLMIMSVLSYVLDMGGYAAAAWLLIKSRSRLYASVNLIRLITGLSLNIWLIVVRGMGLDGYFISVIVSTAIYAGILIWIALHDCGTKFERKLAKEMFSFLMPLVPGNLVMFVSRQLERILVKFQIDLASVGVLEMGYKFPYLIPQLITVPLMQSWNTRRFEIADQEDAPVKIGRMFTWYLFLVSLAGLVLAVTIKPLLIILTPPEFHLAYRIARVEITTFIFDGAYTHLVFGLFYAKHTGVVAKLRGWTSAAKILITWLFISTWGIYGAAFSGAIIGLVTAALGYVLAQRRYSIRVEWGKVTVIAGVSVAMFTALANWDPGENSVFLWLRDLAFPWFNDLCSQTFLGTWKDGKVPLILAERAEPLADLVVKGSLAATFAILLPFIHTPTRHRLRGFWARSVGRLPGKRS